MRVAAADADVAPLPMIFLDPKISAAARVAGCIFPFTFHTFVGQVIEPRLYGNSALLPFASHGCL